MFKRLYSIARTQDLPIDRAACWAFFSNPLNLPEITPPWLKFDPSGTQFSQAYPGLILQYRVTPLPGVRMRWVTEITAVEPGVRFVDEQRFGPYAFWHHQHFFEDIPGGTRVHDLVHYLLPFGPVGRFMHWLHVRRQLEEIFQYRFDTLARKFGSLEPARNA